MMEQSINCKSNALQNWFDLRHCDTLIYYMQSKLRKLGAITVFTGLLNILFFREFGPFGVSLFFLASFSLIVSLFWPQLKDRKYQPVIVSAAALILYISFVFLTRAQGFVLFVSFAGAFVSLFYLLFLLYSRLPFFEAVRDIFIAPFAFLLDYLAAAFTVIDRARAEGEHSTKRSTLGAIIKKIGVGLIIGLPIAGVLLLLLSSADPIFNTATKNLWSFGLSASLQSHLMFTAVLFAHLLPLAMIKRNYPAMGRNVTPSRSYAFEFSVVQLLVTFVLGAFLVIQFPYVFVNVPFETDLSKFGVKTYSEYVTKGFGEFLFIASIVYAILWLGLFALRSRTLHEKNILLPLQLLLFGEFAVFLLSLFRRVYLYGASHGLSLIRIYGAVFLLWVSGIAVILLVRHFKRGVWVKFEVALSVAFLVVVGLFNAEKFIVTVAPPTVNNRIDYVYMSRMSADGYAGWQQSFAYAKRVIETQEQQPVIDKDGRREIFYAGFILDQLLHNYRNVMQDGTPIQQARYKEEQYLYVSQKLTALHDEISTAALSGYGATDSARLKEYAQKVEGLQQKLAAVSSSQELSGDQIRFTHPMGPYEGYKNSCTVWEKADHVLRNYVDQNSCIGSMYQVIFENTSTYATANIQKRDAVDRLIHFNFLRPGVLSQMESEIPHVEILSLFDRYLLLYGKIMKQKPEERTLEVDISFDTPFLD